MRADDVDQAEVTFRHQNLLAFVLRFGQQVAVWIGDERAAPKLQRPFAAHAVGMIAVIASNPSNVATTIAEPAR